MTREIHKLLNKIKKSLIVLLIMGLLPVSVSRGFSQISIHPEIGFSVFPLKYGFMGEKVSSPTILLGVFSVVPFSEKWYGASRVAFIQQNNLEWAGYGIFPVKHCFLYRHNDMSIDFAFSYKLLDRFHVGMGPTFIRKFRSEYSEIIVYLLDDSKELIVQTNTDRFNFGLNTNLTFTIVGFWLKMEYYRQLIGEYTIGVSGNSRYNLTISYPIPFGMHHRSK